MKKTLKVKKATIQDLDDATLYQVAGGDTTVADCPTFSMYESPCSTRPTCWGSCFDPTFCGGCC